MSDQHASVLRRGRLRWSVFVLPAAIGGAFLAISPLTGVPARLVAACLGWTAVASVLEFLSIVGFVLVFKLVFGGRLSWRQSLPAGLRGLAASTVLPAGGLIGPAAGARSAIPHDVSPRVTARSAIAFLILTSAPGVVVLGALGLLVWQGGAAGPHRAVLTLLPAGIAVAIIVATWLVRGSSAGPIRGGAAEAHRLLASLNWQLVGALAYYAFDNAVLWATFHAYGPAPPLSIIVMGYLVGSLAGALPLPAGLGIVEGGMIGALVLYGAPPAPAAGAVLLYRALSLSLSVIPGALAWRGGTTIWPRRDRSPKRVGRESVDRVPTRRAGAARHDHGSSGPCLE
jgi:uncharacterized membrane protein YbhN (UPF0104 family)